MQAPTYTKSGAKATSNVKLESKIFDVTTKSTDLIKKAYLANLANARNSKAKVKTRTEVRGGGRKPWRQKGTGNARAGSIRSPLWRGGGITFGPTGEENHRIRLSKKETASAIKQALSLSKDKINVVEEIPTKQATKTAEVAKVIKKIGAQRRILIVTDGSTAVNQRVVQNISNVAVVSANQLTTRDVIDADSILINKQALELLNLRLGENK